MDQFADGMIARGPTLGADRDTWTGSLHILELPSADAAREFIEREPYNRAGMFADHVIRRFRNRLGRTMWEAPSDPTEPRFFVIAHLRPSTPNDPPPAIPQERLIVHGDLLTPDDAMPAGFALALQAPTREAVSHLVSTGLDERFDVEILDWEFGGRR